MGGQFALTHKNVRSYRDPNSHVAEEGFITTLTPNLCVHISLWLPASSPGLSPGQNNHSFLATCRSRLRLIPSFVSSKHPADLAVSALVWYTSGTTQRSTAFINKTLQKLNEKSAKTRPAKSFLMARIVDMEEQQKGDSFKKVKLQNKRLAATGEKSKIYQ